jgi:hypothetical protein
MNFLCFMVSDFRRADFEVFLCDGGALRPDVRVVFFMLFLTFASVRKATGTIATARLEREKPAAGGQPLISELRPPWQDYFQARAVDCQFGFSPSFFIVRGLLQFLAVGFRCTYTRLHGH